MLSLPQPTTPTSSALSAFLRTALASLALAVMVVIALATQAAAHTDLDSTTPADGATLREPVSLSDPRRLEVPGTVVCTAFPSEDYRAYAEQGMGFLAGLLDHTALDLVDLPTGHWPMWSRPDDLADLVSARAGGDTAGG